VYQEIDTGLELTKFSAIYMYIPSRVWCLPRFHLQHRLLDAVLALLAEVLRCCNVCHAGRIWYHQVRLARALAWLDMDGPNRITFQL
jgi:hypothetical protein